MSTSKPFSLAKRSRYPWVFLAVLAVLATAIHLLIPEVKRAEAYLPAVAASAGCAYFLYAQHLQETRLFTELFRQFNAKYDALNEALNQIAGHNQGMVLTPQDRQALFDYFNLCAEEYLYFKTGFIDAEVWDSWSKGMGHFAAVDHIRVLWEKELADGSYYGFRLELLPKPKPKLDPLSNSMGLGAPALPSVKA